MVLKRPLLVRQINLPKSKYGDYLTFEKKNLYKSPSVDLKIKIHKIIKSIPLEEGQFLLNNDFPSFVQWLTFYSQKTMMKLGLNVHWDFKLEDLIRGYILNILNNSSISKGYWSHFNNKYQFYP